jgi:hypothetical protein
VVFSPQDQLTTSNDQVEVSGDSDEEVRVLINNQQVGIDGQGGFKESIRLNSQVNKITIVAINKFNQETKVERTVYLSR